MDIKCSRPGAWAGALVAASVLTFGLGRPLEAQSIYAPYDFTTLAGIYGSTNGPESSVRLTNPVGIAADGHGNLYVSEWSTLNYSYIVGGAGFSAILKITPAGAVTTLAGGSYFFTLAPQTGAGPVLGFPTSVTVDSTGNVYFVESPAIGMISAAGAVSTLAGGPLAGTADGTGSAARFSGPGGLAVDSSGNVYVADSGNNTIRKIAPGAVVSTLAGTPGVVGSADGTGSGAQFNNPTGIAVDSSGNVYVADTGNDSIRMITPGGVVSTLAGGTYGSADGTGSAAQFAKPSAMAMDGSSNLYVVDEGTIRKVAPGGIVTTLITTSVSGLTVDASGNIFAVNSQEGEIFRITPGGAISVVAGVANGVGSADGTGASARFKNPYGVAVDRSGNVYVADSSNATIRKIAPGGIVSTLAGRAGILGSANGTGSAANFLFPYGVAVDASGNVYVSESDNKMIRKITPGGVVTTLAGTPPAGGFTLAGASAGGGDGTGAAAEFGSPAGIAVDSGGNLFVADSGYDSIRKITPSGVVTTVAGNPGNSGSADGTGSAAEFDSPSGVAVDASGNLYVGDSGNDTIRKITPGGMVTTMAGSPGSKGFADGTGPAAQFDSPSGVAVDSGGNVYVGDSGNNTIRRITPGGVVTTLAGTTRIPPGPGGADGIGPAALFHFPNGVAVDQTGNVYVADTENNTVRVGAPAAGPSVPTEPSFLSQPVSQTLALGGTVVFSVSSGTIPAPSYQWSFDGVPISGATDSMLLVTNATAANSGEYYCVITNSLGTSTASATLTVVSTTASGYLTNLSGRGMVGSGAANGLFGGFGTSGSGSKNLLIRGMGPSLTMVGIPAGTELLDTQLTLYNNLSAAIGQNSLWGGNATITSIENQVGAYPVPANSLDSMLYVPLAPASYSTEVSGVGGATGLAMVEVYDADATPATARLTNVSVRAPVGTGNNILIGGFVIGGTTAETLLIRAVGPSLALPPSNLTGVLAQPVLTLYDVNQDPIYSNTVWGGDPTLVSVQATVGAYTLPTTSHDSLLLVTLPPGAYTAQVSGTNGGTGIASVEIYEVH